MLPRTPEQRAELAGAGGFIVPEHAIDAQSLIAHADLVISAGGTMNREAVALGTPVFTTLRGAARRGRRAADRRGAAAPADPADDVELGQARRAARTPDACAATRELGARLLVSPLDGA